MRKVSTWNLVFYTFSCTQVYPDGFQGKQLDVMDKQYLLSIAASIWAKNELRSRTYLKENNAQDMLSHSPDKWNLSIDIAGEKTVCSIAVVDKAFFEVNFICND